MSVLRILVVGPFGSKQRDEAILRGFESCNCEVRECGYGDLLFSRKISSRIQFRLGWGPVFSVLQKRIVESAKAMKADVVFFRRPLEFSAEMICNIRKAFPAIYASFNNDDPFSISYQDRRWKNCRQAIPEFDIHFAFRRRNLEQFKSAGAKNVALWEPFYSPWIHRPLVDYKENSESFSILFAMHAEKDGRQEALHALKRSNYLLRVHSWNWELVFGKKDSADLGVRPPIWEDDYVKEIGRSSATMCFFSKQNNDELTSRVFEIPACKGLLLSERTDRLGQGFEDKQEAVYFSSTEELLDVTAWLKNSSSSVKMIREKGYQRLIDSGHSVVDRCREAIKIFQDI